MRNTLLSRPQVVATPQHSSSSSSHTAPAVPSIRLISATPSASGVSSTEGSTSIHAHNISIDSSWSAISPPPLPLPSPLAPKHDAGKKRVLVPKKSKLSLLGVGTSKDRDNRKDLSDVVRRVGITNSGTHKSGFEIYVDSNTVDDPEVGEVVMVKKKKSRLGLDAVWGGSGASSAVLGEVSTNVPGKGKGEEKEKEKEKEKEGKWWTIGRGRKDSKEKKEKEAKENTKGRAKSPDSAPEPPPKKPSAISRSKVPEPLRISTSSENNTNRARFNSLDSGILLNTPINMGPVYKPLPPNKDEHEGTYSRVRGVSTGGIVPVYMPLPPDEDDDRPSSRARGASSTGTYSRAGTPTPTYSRSTTPTPSLSGSVFLAPPGGGGKEGSGSIALRAIKSVRSLARMSSWAQLKGTTSGLDEQDGGIVSASGESEMKKEKKSKKEKMKSGSEDATTGSGEKAPKKTKSKKSSSKKEKEKEDAEKDKAATIRQSSSSFEVGALTSSPAPPISRPKSLGKKKHSILGLGLPSSMRLPSARSGSTASSVAPPMASRLSVESAVRMGMGRDRAASTLSSGSSLRPLSTTSTNSRTSSEHSGSSVKWDEEGLRSVKEQRRKEREVRKREMEEEGGAGNGEKTNRHSLEGRKRTPLSEVFPDVRPGGAAQPATFDSPSSIASSVRFRYPVLTVEEATSDGHGNLDEEINEGSVSSTTPVKKARARPLSEQLLGKSRPKPMYENEDGVLSILDAATNDLEKLINVLDLEATPATPDMTPLRPYSGEKLEDYTGSPTKKRTLSTGSPLGKGLRESQTSISSLRPYAHSRGPAAAMLKSSNSNANMIGQQITSWAALTEDEPLAPASSLPPKEALPPAPPSNNSTPKAFSRGHKRTMTPAPEPEPAPVFHPLPASKPRGPVAALKFSPSPAVTLGDNSNNNGNGDSGTSNRPASATFGYASRSSSRSGSGGSVDEGGVATTPTPGSLFVRPQGRKRSSLVPSEYKGSRESQRSLAGGGVPIPREMRRILGMTGTMGGSDVSAYREEMDTSDPDSDVPDELRFILSAANSERGSVVEDTLSYQDHQQLRRSPSPASPSNVRHQLPPLSPEPPRLELPIFQAELVDEYDQHIDIDEGGVTSEEDTKKSFDFTGELKRLNESGGSDRRSFVEQLENAFRTPAKVDLRFLKDGLLAVDIPPVPQLPVDISVAMQAPDSSEGSSAFDSYSASRIVDMKEPSARMEVSDSEFDLYSASRIVDMKEPTMLQSSRTDNTGESKSDFDLYSASRIIDVKEPTLLPGSDSLAGSDEAHDSMDVLEDGQKLSSSTSSRPSNGQLNTAFKFGGLPSPAQPSPAPEAEKPVTLSDIIPPPSHVRTLSMGSSMEEDDSVLKSIYAKIQDVPQPRRRVNSDSSAKRAAREISRRSVYKGASRPSSGISFTGLDSFEEVRRGFEFGDDRVPFYPPPGATRRGAHRQRESVFSIASVSSYGRVVNSGSADPFDYGLPSLAERPSSEDMSFSMSMSVDDTFSFLGRKPRRTRVDSDASSFYFQAPLPQSNFSRGHRRHESNMSVSSQAPPISLYNRSFGTHKRNDSNTSASSVALSYAMHGATGGRAAWARHRQEASTDSLMSDFSGMHIGRPGIGDKMFDTDRGMPLTSIAASPESVANSRYGCDSRIGGDSHYGNRSSVEYEDSILDDDRRSSMDDSLFEKTGNRTSVSSESVFGDDYAQEMRRGLLPPVQFRPLSIVSLSSVHSPMKEDDTMISMLGGGHVRRRSIGSMIEASPCVRIEKRKHSAIQGIKELDNYYESPNKARIVEKPSISSSMFGGERMIKAQHGLLERQSLEDSVLIAEGEDMSTSFQHLASFSRPGPASRSRSSTCTSSSSGGDTPPLSSSDGSTSEGSLSSIDFSHINTALANATHPIPNIANGRARARARGQGHKRRFSKAAASRSSVYETIEEEMSAASSPVKSPASKKSILNISQPVFVVDADTSSIISSLEETVWDDERGIVALRKYYALRNEVETTVTESKRQWRDTPFSVFAVQSFEPPKHPEGMQALLEHSVQNYGPLPSEMRPRRVRSRTHSRPSPYPQARLSKATLSPENSQPAAVDLHAAFSAVAPISVLQEVRVNPNIASPAPTLDKLKPFSPLVIEPKRENAFGLAPDARPRVASTARRTALGWAKRSTGKSSTDQKENVVGQGAIMTPGESLRINRPRPRGRTPASKQRPIRI